MKFKKSFFILCTIFLLGCATQKSSTEKEIVLTEKQIEEINREALKIASASLDELVKNAKTQDSSTQRFIASDIFLKANMSLLNEDYVTASELFKHLNNLDPRNEFVLRKYAVALIRSGNLTDAKDVLKEVYQMTEGKEEKVAMIYAGVLSGIGEEKAARKIYQSILKQNPKNEETCVFLSKSWAMEENLRESSKILKLCSKADPKNGIFDYYLGKIEIENKNERLAQEYYLSALKKQPSLTAATIAMGVMFEEKGQLDKAYKIYQTHLKIQPQDVEVLARIVQNLFVSEKFEEVIPYAEKLSDLNQDDLNIKIKLGILYTEIKSYSKALGVFKELLELAPQSDRILYYIGAIYQELKEIENAVDYYSRINEDSALYAETSVQLAQLLLEIALKSPENERDNKFSQFLSLVETRSAKIKSNQVELAVVHASFYEAQSKWEEAKNVIISVKEFEGFDLAHQYYLANLYEKLQEFESSTSIVMDIIKKDPQNAQAWNFLGYTLLERGEGFEKAYPYIQKAMELNPQDGYIKDTLGWYYFKNGEITKAYKEIKEAFELVPNDPEIVKHLALIYHQMGQKNEAQKYFAKALQMVRFQYEKNDILKQMDALDLKRLPAAQD